jgi:hypothetical protein
MLGRLAVRRMARVVVMAHGTRPLLGAGCADEYLVFQIKCTVSWFNSFEPQLTTALVAMARWRRLGDSAHVISFRRHASELERGAQKGPD